MVRQRLQRPRSSIAWRTVRCVAIGIGGVNAFMVFTMPVLLGSTLARGALALGVGAAIYVGLMHFAKKL